MKKRPAYLNPIAIFVLAQVAWFALVGLWIYWYVRNALIFAEVRDSLTFESVFKGTNIPSLVGGLVLLVAIATAMALIFAKLSNQIRITRMYDNFIANITHELKSPLAAIQLSLETLNTREMPSEQRAEFIKLMMEDSNRLNSLITSILQVAVLEEKRTVYELREYDADALIRTILEDAVQQYKLGSAESIIEGRLSKRCHADSGALRIVFNNLIDNAVKFSVGPADVGVTLSETQKYLVVEVSDRGIGIAGKDLKQVFKKFQRVYSPDSPNVKGTGLGLYWVREIVRHHRGRVSATSEGTLKGSTFRVEIPVSDSRARGT